MKGVGPQRADLLKKELAIFTFNDLLQHYPYRHVDKTKISRIADLHPSIEYAQVQGKLWYYETLGERSARRLIAYLRDDTGVIELTWFKGLNWIEKILKQDETYLAFGRLSFFMGKPQIVHPELEVVKPQVNGTKSFLEPIYPTTEKLKTKGLNGRQIGKLTESLFVLLSEKDFPENLPDPLLKKFQLLPRFKAFQQIHFPSSSVLYDQRCGGSNSKSFSLRSYDWPWYDRSGIANQKELFLKK